VRGEYFRLRHITFSHDENIAAFLTFRTLENYAEFDIGITYRYGSSEGSVHISDDGLPFRVTGAGVR
jgi:hypothetical protein